MPATWQKTMILQGFNPIEQMVNEFIEFCKCLEFAKGINVYDNDFKNIRKGSLKWTQRAILWVH